MPRLMYYLSSNPDSSSSEEGPIIPVDSSENNGFPLFWNGAAESKNALGESSYAGEINDSEVGLLENGKLSEIQEESTKIDGMIVRLLGIFPQLSPDQAFLQLSQKWGQFPAEMVLQSVIDHFLQHEVRECLQTEPEDMHNLRKQKAKKETTTKWIFKSHFINRNWIRKSRLRFTANSNEECHSLAEDIEHIECGCCYNEFPFQKMVQCADGHLFCFHCLRKHVEVSTFGGFQACNSLPCMDTNGCKESIPLSEVKRALPNDVIERYEQRRAQADIERANIDGLVYCPFCNFPCQVDENLRVLACPNSMCLKDSCIQCKKSSHIPFRCEEVEKRSETAMRRIVEEVMTKAVIRVCNSCKAELVKMDGCNKVTCRCGTTMCYACRKTITRSYSHFCEHVRESGKSCSRCKKCGLWETEAEDDAAMAARDKKLKELAEKEPNLLRRNIGPPIEKRRKSADRDSQTHSIFSRVERAISRVERAITRVDRGI